MFVGLSDGLEIPGLAEAVAALEVLSRPFLSWVAQSLSGTTDTYAVASSPHFATRRRLTKAAWQLARQRSPHDVLDSLPPSGSTCLCPPAATSCRRFCPDVYA